MAGSGTVGRGGDRHGGLNSPDSESLSEREVKSRPIDGVRASLAERIEEIAFDQFEALRVQQTRRLQCFAFVAGPSLAGRGWHRVAF